MDEMQKKPKTKNMVAKKEVLMKLRDMAKGMMSEGMPEKMAMRKVSVMSPDKKGLEEGLSKAKELVQEMPNHESKGEEEESESSSEQESMSNMEDMSVEEIKQHIAELKELLKEKLNKEHSEAMSDSDEM